MTAKDFQEPLLQALRTLAGNLPKVPVLAEDTYPVILASTGLAHIDDLGKDPDNANVPLVVRHIQNACKNLRKAGLVELEGRGRWMLTPEGTTPPEVVAPSPGPTRSPHLQDPYILHLTLTQTLCLGRYTAHQGAVCAVCPITAECREAQYAIFSRIAQQFHALENAPSGPNSTDPGTPPPPGATARKTRAVAKLTDRIIAFEEIICDECGKPIRKGDTAIWVENVAKSQTLMYHPECVETV